MPGARLSPDEREEIALGLAVQRSFADIARGLDRPTSTVAREVGRNGVDATATGRHGSSARPTGGLGVPSSAGSWASRGSLAR
jgi:IS30 family transposase